jgi:hypothetical protein
VRKLNGAAHWQYRTTLKSQGAYRVYAEHVTTTRTRSALVTALTAAIGD